LRRSTKVEVKIVRNGEHQSIETFINEEALLFAKYLRREIKKWGHGFLEFYKLSPKKP